MTLEKHLCRPTDYTLKQNLIVFIPGYHWRCYCLEIYYYIIMSYYNFLVDMSLVHVYTALKECNDFDPLFQQHS